MTKPAAEPNAEYCALCRAPASAARHGDHVVAVCPDCAVNALPALIADAIELPAGRGFDVAKLRWLEVERAFWKAIAARGLRRGKARAMVQGIINTEGAK